MRIIDFSINTTSYLNTFKCTTKYLEQLQVHHELLATTFKPCFSQQCSPAAPQGMDCGPESIKLFEAKIKAAKTVVWNGPCGVFEFENFSKGTNAVLKVPEIRSGCLTVFFVF